MIDEKRRLEVKTTTGSVREHPFAHEQVHSELYKILVSSVMLRKDVNGISIKDIVDYGRKIFAGDYERLLVIEETIGGWDTEQLDNYCYDKLFLQNNIRFFDASQIPQFNESTPNFVSNANYSVNLESVNPMTQSEICEFFKT
ncbi:MAG: PD-(D/E)XK motif protein [Candidatus Methanomethylophilus sp.]|jgi:molybdenum cofactor biosynthesis enzyme MoaA|nr:PD-(D/E)XK motif protein [Methanomethylophilus sp.]